MSSDDLCHASGSHNVNYGKSEDFVELKAFQRQRQLRHGDAGAAP